MLAVNNSREIKYYFMKKGRNCNSKKKLIKTRLTNKLCIAAVWVAREPGVVLLTVLIKWSQNFN